MKAEHRKELMTNSLAHRLGDAFQGMKEGPSRGTILVLVAVGVIVILVFVWRYFSSSTRRPTPHAGSNGIAWPRRSN